jgi:hypothetical protein
VVASSARFSVIGLVAGYYERGNVSVILCAAGGAAVGFLIGYLAVPDDCTGRPQPPV